MPSIIPFMITLVVGALGRPLAPVRRASNSGSGGSSNSSAFIATGVVVGGVLLCLIVAYLYYKKRRRSQLPAPANRVLGASEAILATAEASLNATTGTTPPTNASTTTRDRSRRARRTRRTPSQISTKSLPAYKEEPGDQELVLVRRAMDPQMEENEDMDQSITDVSNVSREYSPSPPSSTQVNESLLNADSEDVSGHTIAVSSRRPHRSGALSVDSTMYGSADSHNSAGSGTGLLSNGTEATPGGRMDESIAIDATEDDDTRGEAPPYFEYQGSPVDPDPAPHPPNNNVPTDEITPTSETSHSRNRLSMSMPRPLRSLFSGSLRRTPNAPVTPSPLSPTSQSSPPRQRSDTLSTMGDRSSSRSLLLSRSRSPSHVRLGSLGTTLSRPLTNDSSQSSLSHQRTRSGSSSGLYNATTGAESSTSINSIFISSPLAHTVTRTTISFPKAGPTPEQLKFLSSRESLGRFGVPFGVDAEAAAREARSNPPPAFPSEGEAGPSTASRPSVSQPPIGRSITAPWWETLTSPAAGSSSPPTTPTQELSELSPLHESNEDEPQTPANAVSPTTPAIVVDAYSSPSTAPISHTQSAPSEKTKPSSSADAPLPTVSRPTTRSSSLNVTIPGADSDPEDTSLSVLAVNVIPATPLTGVESH